MPEDIRRVAIYFQAGQEQASREILLKLREFAQNQKWEIVSEYRKTFFARFDEEAVSKQPASSSTFLSELKNLQIDAILTFRLDSLGASIEEVQELIIFLERNKIGLISYSDGLSTVLQGKWLYRASLKIISALKRLESRQKQIEIKNGLKRAKEQGKKLGRPPMPDKLLEKARELRSQNFTFREIARFLGFNESTIRKKLLTKN